MRPAGPKFRVATDQPFNNFLLRQTNMRVGILLYYHTVGGARLTDLDLYGADLEMNDVEPVRTVVVNEMVQR